MDGNTLANKDQLVVEMNPQTARELHLARGRFHQGDQRRRLQRGGSAFVRRGGAGHGLHARGPGTLGRSNAYTFRRGGNYNQVAEATADPLSGLPNWSLTSVTVSKA